MIPQRYALPRKREYTDVLKKKSFYFPAVLTSHAWPEHYSMVGPMATPEMGNMQ